MSTGQSRGNRCAWRAVTVVCCLLPSLADISWAQDRGRPAGEPPIVTCGRARSLAARRAAQRIAPLDDAYREALPDTDVLHQVLDIEVSALNPVANTCFLAGSNLMTIQSKSAALAEFSFRLRDHYSITAAYVDGPTPVTVTTASGTTRVVTLDRTYGLNEVFTLTIEY